ncbi:MAG: START-like domain-containing protein [Candidatus Marisimplicoccus sp.]
MSKKKEFVIEYDFQSSPQLLFQYLSTASGLSEWFSDDVNYRGEKYTFIWGDSEEYARVLSKKINEKIRFQWINGEDDEKDYFFEFKIQMDEITKDVSLIITDYADENELEEAKLLWDSLISDLKQVLGST